MTLSLLLAMKRFSRRSYKEEIVSTVWRHFAAVPITGLLLASTATIAMADTVNPPEGGVWRYGRGYSDYFHGSKKHGSSVQGVNFVRSPCIKAGSWSYARTDAARFGNKAWYRTC